MSLVEQILPHPVLTPLHLEDGFDEVGRRPADSLVLPGPIVRQRQLLVGGLLEKKVTERNHRSPGKGFELAVGRLLPARKPRGDSWLILVQRQTGAVHRPAKDFGFDVDVGGHEDRRTCR